MSNEHEPHAHAASVTSADAAIVVRGAIVHIRSAMRFALRDDAMPTWALERLARANMRADELVTDLLITSKRLEQYGDLEDADPPEEIPGQDGL